MSEEDEEEEDEASESEPDDDDDNEDGEDDGDRVRFVCEGEVRDFLILPVVLSFFLPCIALTGLCWAFNLAFRLDFVLDLDLGFAALGVEVLVFIFGVVFVGSRIFGLLLLLC